MMCIAKTFAVICLDSIDDKKERQSIIKHLKSDGKDIIPISENQMHQFAGNMLQLKTNIDSTVLVMSQSAYESCVCVCVRAKLKLLICIVIFYQLL